MYLYSNSTPMNAPMNRYGEMARQSVYGVEDVRSDMVFPSVRYRWDLKRKQDGQGETRPKVLGVGFEVGPEFLAPRSPSPVNNCTRLGGFSGFTP